MTKKPPTSAHGTPAAPRLTVRSRWIGASIAGVAALAVTVSVAVGIVPSWANNNNNDTDETPTLGCGSAEVTKKLATGSAWRMCARIDPIKGLVLEHVQFRPATGDREYQGWLPVVDSVYLAQLNVPYDNGGAAFNEVTGYGFGDAHVLAQTTQTCPGQTMGVDQTFQWGNNVVDRTIPAICVDEVSTGLSAVGGENSQTAGGGEVAQYAQQGRALEVTSISKLSWDVYQQKVTLTDQGTITVGLGVTGDPAPSDSFYPTDPSVGWPIGPAGEQPATRYAASHWHNAIYRVDFGIGSGDQQVQQWSYSQPDAGQSTRVEATGTIKTSAFHADDEADPMTWWRVLNPTSLNADGHPRSYEISNDSLQDPFDPLTRPEVSFTNDHPCQEYASDNLSADCPGLSVPDYVAAETAPLTDPVAWVSVGYHHIVRDEDQSPMPVHWQEFSLIPRDILTQSATTLVEKSCVNGGPVALEGSCAAVNVVAPRVRTSAPVVTAGTTLTSDQGTWRVARAALTFQTQWLRDKAPIAGATGTQYVVTAADRGHRISARVNATGDGITPGSAASAERLIPSVSTVTATQLPKGRPGVKVRVTGKVGVPTGTVVVTGPKGWKRIVTLHKGGVVVPVSKAITTARSQLVVTYRGDSRYLPGKKSIRLRPPAH